MRPLTDTTWAEFKHFLREPPGNIFALAMPLIALLVFGAILGNEPHGEASGYGPTDLSMPGQFAIIIGAAGLIVAPPPLVAYRRRSPLGPGRAPRPSPAVFLGSQFLVDLAVAVVGALAVIAVGWLVFGLRAPRAPLAVTLAFGLSCLSMIALGFLLGALLPTAPLARVIGIVLFGINIAFSGSTAPPEQLPAVLRAIGAVLPLTYVRALLHDLWVGQRWNLVALAVLVAILVAAGGLAALVFRPRGQPSAAEG